MSAPTAIDRYLPIDEDGYFVFDGRRVDDPDMGRTLINHISVVDKDRFVTSMTGTQAWVEAFNAPLVVRHVQQVGSDGDGRLRLELPYGAESFARFTDFCVDEWDRFHGVTESRIPFVLSRQAQVELFNLLEGFDDDSITVGGRQYPVPPWLTSSAEVGRSQFWNQLYSSEVSPWDLDHEHKALPVVIPQLKLNRARVLVLGCGGGHDAAYFAQQGHLVTAVDFSPEALKRAKARHGGLENITWVQADIFTLPESLLRGNFDLVFEHTCYCAINPERRSDLVRVWRQALAPGGHLLGIFFVNEKRTGPPFGGSEWEVRQRLQGHFRFLYWTRWRASEPDRQARELVVFARKAQTT